MEKPENRNPRVRFAPSPTGEPHLGNLRTALFNWLYARGCGGKFVLRIDDTDLSRTAPGAEQAILESLRWLGLPWDEGPAGFDGAGPAGEFGPYRQSERLGIYRKYLDQLLSKGAAYPCFCTEEQLELERAAAIKSGKAYRYSGRCRSVPPGEQEKLLAAGECHSLRLKVLPQPLRFRDLVRGEMNANANEIGEFIIRRSDGIPTYNLACVTDDYLMKISLVIRAEDHLYNTFSQLLLYKSLGFEPPEFAHLPLILGLDRKPLSKREQAGSIRSFQQKGYLPEALVNYLALLGFSHPEAKEFLAKDELVKSFKLDRVSKSAAVSDLARLDWLNKKHLRALSARELLVRSENFFRAAGVLTEKYEPRWTEAAVDSFKENVTRLDELPDWMKIYTERPEPEAVKKLLASAAEPEKILDRFLEQVVRMDDKKADEALFEPLVGSFGKKQVFTALRQSLTGRGRGPELIALINILGKQEVAERIKAAKLALER